MRDTWDVVIAGGAVMGASAAYWLTRMQPGLRVMVVEMDPTYARSSTALSVASIRHQFTNPVNVEISRFGFDFIRDFQNNIGAAAGVPDLGLKENGYLFLTGSDEAAAVMAEVAGMQRQHGGFTEVLDRDGIAARFPWLTLDDVVAGSFGPVREGWFDNMGLLNGFRAAARAQGAVFVTDRVVGAVRDGDRVMAVRLAERGEVACGAVVNAMGTRAAELLRWLDEDLAVEPRKRTVFVIDAPNAKHPDAPLLVDHTGFYIRPEGDGQWITAIVPDDDGPVDAEDFEPRHQDFEELIWERLYSRCAGFDAVKVLRFWVGHYAYNTLDQNAVLGPHPHIPNLFLMNGFSGHGLQQSPAVGRGIAEILLTGRYQTLDLSQLGVARMLEGRPFAERAIV